MNNDSTGSKQTETSDSEAAPTLNRRENSPDYSIRADGPVAKGGDATIHDRTGLYIAILALLVAGMALGFEISRAMKSTEDRVNAAEVRRLQEANIAAQIQAGAAQAEATAREARTEALVTKDKLEELRDALNAKGMKIPKLDGHN